ncbi:hypothetical protein ACSQ67_021163 [Phaseolus vulgaris]
MLGWKLISPNSHKPFTLHWCGRVREMLPTCHRLFSVNPLCEQNPILYHLSILELVGPSTSIGPTLDPTGARGWRRAPPPLISSLAFVEITQPVAFSFLTAGPKFRHNIYT